MDQKFKIVLVLFIIFNTTFSDNNYYFSKTSCGANEMPYDSQCFNENHYNALPVIQEDVIYSFKHSIFFIKTSCNGGLSQREVCAIEAAAKLHPNKQVFVFFVGPLPYHCLKTSPLNILLEYENIHINRLRIQDYIKHTPLRHFPVLRYVLKSISPVQSLTDILKFITLYKYGGIYLDLDVLLLKPLIPLRESANWVGYYQGDSQKIGTALMAASNSRTGKKNKFIKLVLRILKKEYFKTLDIRSIVSKALSQICRVQASGNHSTRSCQALTVLPKNIIYRTMSDCNEQRLFKNEPGFFISDSTIAIHILCDYTNSHHTIEKYSFFAKAMEDVCPLVTSDCEEKSRQFEAEDYEETQDKNKDNVIWIGIEANTSFDDTDKTTTLGQNDKEHATRTNKTSKTAKTSDKISTADKTSTTDKTSTKDITFIREKKDEEYKSSNSVESTTDSIYYLLMPIPKYYRRKIISQDIPDLI